MRRQGIPCEMQDGLQFGNRSTSRVAAAIYTGMTVHAPGSFGALYHLGAAYSRLGLPSPVRKANTHYADQLLRAIRAGGFDTVVCSHLFPAEAVSYLKQTRAPHLTCIGIATDYTCIPFWSELKLDAHCVAHPSLLPEYRRLGVDPRCLYPTGIPVSRAFAERLPRAEARRRLKLPAEGELLLVMSGSMGYGKLLQLADCFVRRRRAGMRMILLAGHNHRLIEKLRERVDADVVRALPYTRQVPLYMDACNVMLTKPGGLTSTEAAVKQLPLVHTAPIPGCETRNLRFFVEHGMALDGRTPEMALDAAVRLLDSPRLRQRQREAQARMINPDAAGDICRLSVRLNGGRTG